MILSVIIPAYNSLTDVLRCMNTLGSATPGKHQLVIQDDCSPVVDFTEFIHPGIIERNAVNLGFAGNCNAGAQRAVGDILLFINQDVYAKPERSMNWDAAILNAFNDPQVGIVGARLLFPDGKIQSAGGWIDPRGTPFHRCLGYSNPDYEEVATAQDVGWVTGACLAIRRELFWSVGGFDTVYAGGYFEDVDLCLKIRALGYRVRYEPGCTLYHAVGSTGGSPRFMQNALTFRERWAGKVKPDIDYLAPVRFW